MNTHVRDNLISILPIATMILRAAPYTTTETAVEGRWLQCNGVAVSRTTYADLFNYLNSLSPALPFGEGDLVTTFNLPDMRGRTAYAEGEHADVDVMGDSDALAIASRGPAHHHRFDMEQPASGNGNNPGAGNTLAVGQDGTTTGGGAQDKPSYLVVGSYFIKFN